MTTPNQSRAINVLLGIAVLVGVGLAILWFSTQETMPAVNEPITSAPQGAPAFAWSYRSFEEDEIPRSTISLTATYPDGATQTKEIETIEGGCNDYDNADADVYAKSTEIICYYAGFGRYYKVVESNGSYLVQRKEFEEASPDYNPPVQEFETIERF